MVGKFNGENTIIYSADIHTQAHIDRIPITRIHDSDITSFPTARSNAQHLKTNIHIFIYTQHITFIFISRKIIQMFNKYLKIDFYIIVIFTLSVPTDVYYSK